MQLTLAWEWEGETKTEVIGSRSMTVGRGPQCDIVIPHATVSRQHLEIFLQDNRFHLRNLSHTNPVIFENGAVVAKGGTAVLHAGETFLLGKMPLTVMSIDESPLVLKLQCPNCGRIVDAFFADCPWCGASLAAAQTIYSTQK